MKKLLTNVIIVLCAFIIGGVMASYEEKYGILTAAEPEYTSPSKPAITVDKNHKININTATQEELMQLNSVGEALSQRIIEYREENGNFYLIEDIMKVNGINSGKFNEIKDFIYTE